MPARRRGARSLLIMALVAGVAVVGGPAGAAVTCSYSDPVVTVSIDSAYQTIVLDRASDGTIQVNGAFCPGPEPTYATVFNTDLIRITDSSPGQTILWLDLARGGFAPGKTSEATGVSEIEIVHTLEGPAVPGGFRIIGTSDPETITFGSDGIEWTGDDDMDVDFEQISNLDVLAREGNDIISGRGSAATGGPATYQTFLLGEDGDDQLYAGDFLNYLGGGAGNDQLRAFVGEHDYLEGGAGADLLDGGGGGNDTAAYGTSPAAITIDLTAATASGGDADGDSLSGIEAIFGTIHPDVLIGDAAANYLIGGGGDDRLEGRGGNDRLQGDTGNDLMLGEDGDDIFEEGERPNGADDMHGGPGAAESVGYTQREGPVSVTRDNQPNDGEVSEGDNVHFDVEIARTKDSPGPPPPRPTATSSPRVSVSPAGTPTPGASVSPSASGAPTPSASPSSSPSPSQCRSELEVAPSERASTGDMLLGISAAEDGAGFAVGSRRVARSERTLIEKWTGSRWAVVATPNRKGQLNRLDDVDARTKNDVWAVGASGGNRLKTLVLHRNASGWSIVRSPNPGRELSVLSAVEAIGPSNVWAVGDRWDGGRVYRPLIERFNGSRWTVANGARGVEGRLRDVAATGASDVWAVGVKDKQGRGQTLIQHFNGSRWSVIPSPNVGEGFNILEGIDAVSRSNVWAVGYRRGGGGWMKPLILHYNGDRWTSVPVPNTGRDKGELYSVAAVSADDVWAVGSASAHPTLVLHYDGTSWEVVRGPDTGTSSNEVMDVTATSSGTVWAAGFSYLPRGETRPLVLQRCTGN